MIFFQSEMKNITEECAEKLIQRRSKKKLETIHK
jgi:hypothetical protein